MHDPYLIEAAELHALLGSPDVKIIDTRDPQYYELGHLPGALHIPEIFTYLCLPDHGGLDGLAAAFANRLSVAGIAPSDRVIIYEDALDNGYGRSCRGWLILKYLGHSKVWVLHGGLRAWLSAGYPVDTAVPRVQPVAYPCLVQAGIMVDSAYVLSGLGSNRFNLVDCRDYAEWLGANSSPYGYDYCPLKGRIPSALWLEWYRVLQRRAGIPWFASPTEIDFICQQAGIRKDLPTVVYCFKGARSSVVVMALRMAGYPDVRNYFSSWNEWSRLPDVPFDTDYPD